jgi:DNA-binding beta-propeller fold protein YncE
LLIAQLAVPANAAPESTPAAPSPASGSRFDSSALAEPIPGIIAAWELSPTARAFDISPERYLDGKSPGTIPWLSVKSEPSGLVDIAGYRKPVAEGTSKVWARAVVQARQKESRPFVFGYRDAVSIYLNGRILYHGQNGFQRQDPSLSGTVGWNNTVYLPLEAGENELVLMASGKAGGWFLGGRDMDAIYRHPGLQDVWEIPDRLNAPESVALDAGRNVLYVSNFGGDCISKIGLDGAIVALRWVTGLKAPAGLKFFAGKLYAVERSGVAEIDPETGVIIGRHPIPDAAFPNDLAIANDGVIYVTDSFKNCISRLSGGKCEVWIAGKAVENPNGILVEKERLLVGVTADSTIKSIDLKTKQANTFLTLGPGANMDGLVTDGKGGYLFSDYYGRIFRADAAGQKALLLDRSGPRQYTADFEYIPETGLLIVPSLYDNRLTAYRLAAP